MNQIRIWWDSSVQAYQVVTPYNEKFVEALKMLIPFSNRVWDKKEKRWTISENYLEPMKATCEAFFKVKPIVITKLEAENASKPREELSSSSLDKVMAQFVKLLPYEALRKAYLLGANAHHPDKGGDMTKMTELNSLWQRIEKEFYKV